MNIVLAEKLFQKWIVQKRTDDNIYKELKSAIDEFIAGETFPFRLEKYKETMFDIALEAALRCYLDDAFHQTQEANEKGELNAAVHTNLLFPYTSFVAISADVVYAKKNWEKIKILIELAIPITAAVAVLLNEHLEE